MLASVTHIAPLTSVRRARTLPVRGRVIVHVGQKVNATDPVAACHLPGHHILLDIRRALGIERVSTVQKILERTVGEKVQKGDIIAQTGGIFSRVVRAPSDGEIVAIQKGQVLIQLPEEPFELEAGITGVVVEVMPELGVVIESSGVLVQGVWGNNQVDIGVLTSLANSPEDELIRPHLDMTLRGAVVLAGHVTEGDALEAAGELPVRGLILGSMTANLIPIAEKMTFPIMLLEGFGRIPIAQNTYQLLLSNTKRDVSINASWKPNLGERPEVVIPLPAAGAPANDQAEFKPGQTVKIVKAPYFSQTGTLVQVRPGLTSMPSGLRLPAADIRLQTGEQVAVPLVNLTVIE